MQIVVLATGTCRDGDMLSLEGGYHEKMIAGWPITVRELRDNPKNLDIEATHQIGAWQGLPAPKVLVVLDEKGQSLTSEKFAKQLQDWGNRGIRTIAFLIGGVNGVPERTRKEATMTISLSAMTLPHQLVRVFLAEQLYRAGTIMSGHPYHRG